MIKNLSIKFHLVFEIFYFPYYYNLFYINRLVLILVSYS